MHEVEQYGLQGMRVAVVQQVLPHYRVPFFTRMVDYFGVDLSVYADLHPSGSLDSIRVDDPFNTIHAPLHQAGPFLYQSAILKVVNDNLFDAVVLSWNARYLQLPFALFKARACGMPVALWGHGYSKNENSLRSCYRNWLLKQADVGITYNQSTKEKLVSKGIPPEHLFTACNSIDQAPVQEAIASWENRHDELERFRETNGLNPERTAIFVSRIEKEKGLPFLIRAFRKVLEDMPDAKLIIVGDGKELPHIKRLVIKLGLGANVICTGSIYSEEELAPWMLNSTCLVCPRAVGLTIIHGFGYGLPCVASNDIYCHGPEFEALVDGKNGLIFKDGDVDSLARQIKKCFDPDAQQSKMRTAAKYTVIDNGPYSLETMAQGFAQALNSFK